MSGNIVLDVAISLVFIYLLYSLMATILMELIAWLLDLRAKMLTKTIRVMLEDRQVLSESHNNWLIRILANPFERFFIAFYQSIQYIICPFPRRTLAKAFYKHPSIKYLGESIWNNKPSYITSTTFAETIIKILRGKSFDGSLSVMDAIAITLLKPEVKIDIDENEEATIDPQTLYQVRQIFYDAKGDANRFQQLLEEWFEEVSLRSTGWYKKQTQFYLLIMGFCLAFQFNVDTISIYKIVAKDEKARAAIVNVAIESNKQHQQILNNLHLDSIPKDSTGTYLARTHKMLQDDAENANLVLGMGKPFKDSLDRITKLLGTKSPEISHTEQAKLLNAKRKYQKDIENLKFSEKQIGGWATTLCGWFITALAISLGAPFWFDLLNKLVQLRNSGKKPEEVTNGNLPQNSPQNVSPKNRVG